MASNRTRKLYNPFREVEYFECGGYGYIFRIPASKIVIKIPHRIINGTAEDDARARESQSILRREQAVYEELYKGKPHPNIVQYFLSLDYAIFLKFEPDTLEKRLDRHLDTPIPEDRHFRWAKEITSAASWLESLDYFHGDLRPSNILLDENEHVKLCDFGRTSKRGEKIQTVTYPFYRPSRGYAFAGPTHEQFAIGSCIYNIRFCEIPYSPLRTPTDFQNMYDKLVCGVYPSTASDNILGCIILNCWNAKYTCMKSVEEAIKIAVGNRDENDTMATILPADEYDSCVKQCRTFKQDNDSKSGHGDLG